MFMKITQKLKHIMRSLLNTPINCWTMRIYDSEDLNKKYERISRHFSIERAEIYVLFHIVLLICITGLFFYDKFTYYYALGQELGTIIPILACLAVARFKPAAIEAIIPLNAVTRFAVAYFFFMKYPTEKCVPRVLLMVSNLAPITLPLVDIFLFRTHFVVFYMV